MGVAIVPEMTIRLAQSIKKPKIYSIEQNSTTWDIIIAYRKDAYISNAEREFFEMTQSVFSKDQYMHLSSD